MKETLSAKILRQAKAVTLGESFGGAQKLEEVHCSWCANCSGIVGG